MGGGGGGGSSQQTVYQTVTNTYDYTTEYEQEQAKRERDAAAERQLRGQHSPSWARNTLAGGASSGGLDGPSRSFTATARSLLGI